MSNEASKLGLYEILSLLDDNAVLSLAGTTTQGLLKNKIVSRQEAVSAIYNYSPDVITVLRRKIITREILFSYLHKKNISIPLPATKNDLIQKVAEFWDIQYQQEVEPRNLADSETVTLLAEQFSHWFYSMMNKNECLDPEHFYPDAKLKINMVNNGQVFTEYVENNPHEIVQKLFLAKMNFNLYFNPNLSKDGVRGVIDPHGLVIVMACGTLHVNNACVGIFEQVFGLVRDPQAANNWKIKNCEINLKSDSGVYAMPTLPSSNNYHLSLS